MSERLPDELLQDIIEAGQRAIAYCKNMDYAQFSEDTKTQDAVVRNMEIIGEAAKKLPKNLREKYSRVPWKSIAGMRDKLIHHYFGINIDIVWDVVSNDLPKVISELT